MSKIGLLVFLVTLTFPLSGVSYATDKITLTCSGMQWDGSFPIKKETVPPQSVIIDLDKGIVPRRYDRCVPSRTAYGHGFETSTHIMMLG